MNPWHLSATGLVVWGIVAHLIADWLLQNSWMARFKAERAARYDWWRVPLGGRPMRKPSRWWSRHPAAYVHAALHGVCLAFAFGWPAAPLAFTHLIIDTRTPLTWWGRKFGQTAAEGRQVMSWPADAKRGDAIPHDGGLRTLFDMGTEVAVWRDQVAHVACIAVAALAVTA